MVISKKIILDVNLSFLICTFYTLSNDDTFFKVVNIRGNLFLHINNFDYFYKDFKNPEEFLQFYKFLNKSSLRRFGYILLNPFLTPNNSFSKSTLTVKNETKEIFTRHNLLKKYLQNFKRNYRRHFLYQNGNYPNLPTDREINTFALKLLFLLVGI